MNPRHAVAVIIVCLIALIAAVAAHAGSDVVSTPFKLPHFAPDKPDDGVPKKYTPAIRGLLVNGSTPLATANVCVREDNSEIRSCGYTDFSGRFYIAASGRLHPARGKVEKDGTAAFPKFWIETGRVNAARRLGTVALVDDKQSTIDLECDVSRSAALTSVDANACRPMSSAPKAPSESARHGNTTTRTK
jgi:hypothetical protein